MRAQIDTLRTVVPTADTATEARSRVLADRDRALQEAARLGWVLAGAATIPGVEYVTFVDTLTYTPTDQ